MSEETRAPTVHETPLHETPLHERHAALGARFVEFAGWRMPLQYTSILDEHRAVRERAGLFDLCHMGEIVVAGAEAGRALDAALVSWPSSLRVGRAQYSMICNAEGGVLDDLIVYRLAEDRFMVVANAANAALVSDLLTERVSAFGAIIDDRSLATGLVAVQGTRAADIVARLTDLDLAGLRSYAVAEGSLAGLAAVVARTGYTGEDGFEIFVEMADVGRLWDAVLAAGRVDGLVPVGLGARDTLRLEAGMPLYGNELDPATNPFEAGLGMVVRFDKPGDFVGRAALERVAAAGPAKRRVGLVIEGRGIARHGHPVFAGDRETGVVTSGTLSPTLGVPIAMAYVAPTDAEPGTMLAVGIRGTRVPARVVPLPFYRRPR